MKVYELIQKIGGLSPDDELFICDGVFRKIDSIEFYQNFDDPGKAVMMLATGEVQAIYEMAGGELCQSTK